MGIFCNPVQGSGSLLLLVKTISRLFFEISLVIVFYGTLLNHKSQMEILVAYAFFFLLFLVRRVQEKGLYENTVGKTHFHYYINIQNLRFSSKPFSGRVQ